MPHREVDGVGDEADSVGAVVEGFGFGGVSTGGDGDPGAQDGLAECHAVGCRFTQGSARRIALGDDGEARAGAERQIAQQMASRERGQQQIFGIVERGIAQKGRIG